MFCDVNDDIWECPGGVQRFTQEYDEIGQTLKLSCKYSESESVSVNTGLKGLSKASFVEKATISSEPGAIKDTIHVNISGGHGQSVSVNTGLEALSSPSSVEHVTISSEIDTITYNISTSGDISTVLTPEDIGCLNELEIDDSTNTDLSDQSSKVFNIDGYSDPEELTPSDFIKAKSETNYQYQNLLGHAVNDVHDQNRSTYNSVNSSKESVCLKQKVKRRRRREKNPNPIPNVPVLPPCKICDEKSSGFHYGANTCEACKGFFRRTLKRKEVVFQCKCTGSEKLAWQQGPYKNGCPACRYERCLKVGMSKSASKIGRYTLDRKTDNIREVKALEAMDVVIENAILSSINDARCPSHWDSTIIEDTGSSYEEDRTILDVHVTSVKDTHKDRQQSESRQCYPTVAEIKTIVRKMTEAHKPRSIMDPHLLTRSKEEVDRIHRKYLEDYNLRQSLFGHMSTLSKEEYEDFFKTTGIDIDGRQASMEQSLEHFTKKLVQFVEFARIVPGFKDLSVTDQIKLIKCSMYEHILLASYRGMLLNLSPEIGVFTSAWGRAVSFQDITRLFPLNVVRTRFYFCQCLEKLNLTIEEEAILRGIVLTFSDRCELENPEAVQNIQETLMACLEYLFSLQTKRHKNPLYKVFDLLVKFRDFSERHFDIVREAFLQSPCISKHRFSLMREFFQF